MDIFVLHAATHAAVDSLVSLLRNPTGKRGDFYVLLQLKARELEKACSAESQSRGFTLRVQPVRESRTLDGYAREIEEREAKPFPGQAERALELSHIACLAASIHHACFDFLDDV